MKISPLGAVFALAVIAGVVLFVVGSRAVAVIGAVVTLVGVVGIIASQLPGGLVAGRGGAAFRRRRELNLPEPSPDYIEAAKPASEEAWQREQERYRQRTD